MRHDLLKMILVDRIIDSDRIEKESEFDGFSILVTNQLKLSDSEIIKAYSNQYIIEQSFKITKSELEARPTYVNTDNHLQGPFLNCFLSLLFLRILERKLDYQYSIGTIIDNLKRYRYDYDGLNLFKLNLDMDEEMIEPLTNKKTNCIFKLHDIFNLGFIQERLTISEIRNIFQKLRIFNFYEHITLKK